MFCENCGFENAEGDRFCRRCGLPLRVENNVYNASGRSPYGGNDGKRLGPYELVGELGRGAMARVWRAWDPRLRREVAIKEPLFDPSQPLEVLEEMGRRFVAEGVAAARLNHPNIVTIHEADVYDGRPAIVMELVDGATLASLLAAGALEPSVALNLVDQLLGAVGYAHARGIVYRDIKPENVFVSRDGLVKLADFGIAHFDNATTHATVAGAVLGTPGYMSPEQALGRPVDARSDLFSIGVVTYEMLTGRNPFGDTSRDSSATLLYRIVHEPPDEHLYTGTSNLPQSVCTAIMAALAKNPAERPQSAREFRDMLYGEIVAPSTPVRQPILSGRNTSVDPALMSAPHLLPYVFLGVAGVAVISFALMNAISSAPASAGGLPPKVEVVSDDSVESGSTAAVSEMGSRGVSDKDSDTGSEAYDDLTDVSDPVRKDGLASADAILTEPSHETSEGSEPQSLQATAEPTAPQEPSHAQAFPRRWMGTYVGTSSYANTPDHHLNRAVAFDFIDVTEDGHLSGVCYVGTDTPGPGETYGTCYVDGNIDWNTGTITLQGTSWIDQGGLGELRLYRGSVDYSSQTMGGTAADVGTGYYETPWNVFATDQISILQNGYWTTIP